MVETGESVRNPRVRERGKKRGIVFIKLCFSLALIVFLLTVKTSPRDILEVLVGIDVLPLAVALSLHIVGLLVSAYRWQILAQAQGDDIPFGVLVKSYLIGAFFSQFLPSSFGGDAVRIWDGSKYSRSLARSSAVVIVERLTGIVVLFVFAFLASLLRLDMAAELPVVWVSLVLGFFGLAGVIVFFLPPAERLREGFLGRLLPSKIRIGIGEFRRHVLHYKTQRRSFLRALIWAFILQINVVVFFYLIGLAFRLEISFLDYFVFIPIVLLIQIIPVTINGLGLREGAYIQIFAFYGISPHAAFSFSLVDVGFRLLLNLAGGILFVVRK
jgi:glycosyltransferase 2 family protein